MQLLSWGFKAVSGTQSTPIQNPAPQFPSITPLNSAILKMCFQRASLQSTSGSVEDINSKRVFSLAVKHLDEYKKNSSMALQADNLLQLPTTNPLVQFYHKITNIQLTDERKRYLVYGLIFLAAVITAIVLIKLGILPVVVALANVFFPAALVFMEYKRNAAMSSDLPKLRESVVALQHLLGPVLTDSATASVSPVSPLRTKLDESVQHYASLSSGGFTADEFTVAKDELLRIMSSITPDRADNLAFEATLFYWNR